MTCHGREYYAFDGDRIGKRLEHLVLQNKDQEIMAFAKSVSNAISELSSKLQDLGCTILFVGGDSILAFSDIPINIEKVQRVFCNISFSVGIGGSPREALIALVAAKLEPAGAMQRHKE